MVKKVCFLRKIISGLKQSAYQWYKDLNKNIIQAGLQRLISNFSAFAKNLGTTKVVIIIVYINYFLLFGPKIMEINIVKLV